MAPDKELAAIEGIVTLLDPLDVVARARVINYVVQRLAIAPERELGLDDKKAASKATSIFSLTQKRKPTRDIEMATLVAYYLMDVAPQEERRDYITSEDIVNLFRQARFALPGEARYTLKNAKTAGYLEPAGRGRYKITPTGINFVEHPPAA